MPIVPIVLGGVHPTLMPEQCLRKDCIDYVILHEGEKTIVALANAIRDRQAVDVIDGISYKHLVHVCINPFEEFENDLDTYEMDWTVVNIENYIRSSYGGVDRVLFGYTVGRECPHNCGFCYNQVFNKRHWRHQSATKAFAEINQLVKQHNLGGILFYDDNLTVELEEGKWCLL